MHMHKEIDQSYIWFKFILGMWLVDFLISVCYAVCHFIWKSVLMWCVYKCKNVAGLKNSESYWMSLDKQIYNRKMFIFKILYIIITLTVCIANDNEFCEVFDEYNENSEKCSIQRHFTQKRLELWKFIIVLKNRF